MSPEIPPSSDELRRWLAHARQSTVTIERGIKGLNKAIHNITRLTEKAPEVAEKRDDPEQG